MKCQRSIFVVLLSVRLMMLLVIPCNTLPIADTERLFAFENSETEHHEHPACSSTCLCTGIHGAILLAPSLDYTLLTGSVVKSKPHSLHYSADSDFMKMIWQPPRNVNI